MRSCGSPGEIPRALNLASAIAGALACGLIVLVAAELSGSIAAAAAAALLFAASYTFWSQAIIAEVYALHIVFVSLTLLLLLRWARQPTLARLAVFFAVYALGFGNHLSMILLAPAYGLFLVLAAPRGWRSLVAPRVVALALGCAIAGALQYAGSLRALWVLPHPPEGLVDGLRMFWFDVTKSDWRDTMVFNVPRDVLADHAAMYWFDLRQQFGVVGPLLACAGLVRLAVADLKRAVLLFVLYAVNVAFAFSYNVGDTHVFYLPSHLIVALLAAAGVTWAGHFGARAVPVAAALLALYAAGRAHHDFPALDRSRDTRPAQMLAALTSGLNDQHAILLADLNWQVQNGLAYFTKAVRPEVAYGSMPDVLLYAPALVADNRAIGREVFVTERARAEVTAAYGPLLRAERDPRADTRTAFDVARAVDRGTRYVLCVLRPPRDLPTDEADIARAIDRLTGGGSVALPANDYVALAGLAGEPPQAIVAADRPFRTRATLGGVDVEIRMDSWLAADTIRRMGFGHVIAARVHTLIVERGVSFVAFDEQGQPIHTAYASNIFAPQPRYLIGASKP